MKLYIDYENRDVYTEEQYEEEIELIIENNMKHSETQFCKSFDRWLNEDTKYTPSYIFHTTNLCKGLIVEEYKKYARKEIKKNWKVSILVLDSNTNSDKIEIVFNK